MFDIKKAKTPTTLVIFGATGDLMAKKVLPALYHLWIDKRTPRSFRVLGVSRQKLSQAAFRKHVSQVVREHQKKESMERQGLREFLKMFSYQQADLTSVEDYKKINDVLLADDAKAKTCFNKLFYLAIPPALHFSVLNNLAKAKMTVVCSDADGWTRVVFEKPFGRGYESAIELNSLLKKLFKPSQIYLIDHYLGKEILQSIMSFRFANNFLDGFLNNKYVDRIEINLLEKIGVETRGAFYDTVGALRDVGQNHMLQMLALVTMDHPSNFSDLAIRAKRAEILQALKIFTKAEIKKYTFRGQYENYKKVRGVRSSSSVETYFKTAAFIETPRWRGVPIYLQSGKKLSKAEKNITVYLKHQSPCLCPPDRQHYQNKIVFSLEPQQKFSISFQDKLPGFATGLDEQNLTFLHRDRRRNTPYVEEYEKLLFDVIVGDQTLFVSQAEMVASWRYIDPIVKAWENKSVKLCKYKVGSRKIMELAEIVSDSPLAKAKLRREIGIIGLGKMGAGLALNLADSSWQVWGSDKFKKKDKELAAAGISIVADPKELVAKLKKPRLVWLMVPSGKPVDDTLFGKDGLDKLLDKGDIIIDGGNSKYTETIKRIKRMSRRGITMMDAGVSGGPGGARHGACIMVGGDQKTFDKLHPLFVDLTVPRGVEFFPGPGAGHFVKMVHNGIEYGMMQAIAEGFAIMKHSKFKPDLQRVASVYNHGSVIESMLIEWLYHSFREFGVDLDKISGKAAESGEGRWTVETAKRLGIQAKVIKEALRFRHHSQNCPSYTGKVVSALRGQFGGHPVYKEDDEYLKNNC